MLQWGHIYAFILLPIEQLLSFPRIIDGNRKYAASKLEQYLRATHWRNQGKNSQKKWKC